MTGIKYEDGVFRDGVVHPRTSCLQGGHELEASTNVLTFGRDGIPHAGQEFAWETRITIFETDLPTQHFWSPQSGKHYRVLWTRTFREGE